MTLEIEKFIGKILIIVLIFIAGIQWAKKYKEDKTKWQEEYQKQNY